MAKSDLNAPQGYDGTEDDGEPRFEGDDSPHKPESYASDAGEPNGTVAKWSPWMVAAIVAILIVLALILRATMT